MVQFEELPKWVEYDENDKFRIEEDLVDGYGRCHIFLRYCEGGLWGVGYYPEDDDDAILFEEKADSIGVACQKTNDRLEELKSLK